MRTKTWTRKKTIYSTRSVPRSPLQLKALGCSQLSSKAGCLPPPCLEITQIASASLDINRVLNQATTRSAQAIQAQRCSILLLDPREKIYPLVCIDAEGKAMEDEAWDQLQSGVKDPTFKHAPIRQLAANTAPADDRQ